MEIMFGWLAKGQCSVSALDIFIVILEALFIVIFAAFTRTAYLWIKK